MATSLEVKKRMLNALSWRIDGKSYIEIGSKMGISSTRARQLVWKAWGELYTLLLDNHIKEINDKNKKTKALS